MSFFRRNLGDTPNQLIPQRGARMVGTAYVSTDTAMRHSAVWTCLRLRADLVSTMEVKSFRDVKLGDGGEHQAEVGMTPFLDDPAGDGFGREDFLYSSQVDLDRAGNTIGIITSVDGYGLPASVELAQLGTVTIKGKGSRITGYRIGGTDYAPKDVWHERQFTLPGTPLGLSPITYAALSIGSYLSAQDFGNSWFANGRVPTAALKNVEKTLKPDEADIVKKRFKEAIEGRDIFVTGKDWEYDMLSVTANESQFIDLLRFGVLDVARFMGVPADLVDAEVQSGTRITYANITQRHLQFLVMGLSATLVRRERFISRKALAKPRYLQFQPKSSLLRMDPQTAATVGQILIDSRQRTPTELRELDGLLPYTQDQVDEFTALFPSKRDPNANPSQQGVPQ